MSQDNSKNPLAQAQPVAPLHTYFRPWPPGGGTQLALATIINGTLYVIPYGSQPLVLPTHDQPTSSALFFNFAPGLTATQIQQGSWPCRKIIFYAPSTNGGNIYLGTQGVSPTTANLPIPPGGSGVIDISDVTTLYWVADIATDIIAGWAESNL